MDTRKWTESVIGMEKPAILLDTGVPPGDVLLAARRCLDAGPSFACLTEGEKNGRE
ncbi:hypothetical protein DEO72_LG2g2836 [Vigna unguiculata]|uniref:Uncharacterized protein n=1 Tax=Vigna unguiculata TaxID=3917 RepID=A0A4D6L1U8_VIGUN|nr:hypothetical protein DEO72_LG2g2836 [Vigna unguiculata]